MLHYRRLGGAGPSPPAAHPYAVQFRDAKLGCYLHSFTSFTDKLANSFHCLYVPSYKLTDYKRGASRHLQCRNRAYCGRRLSSPRGCSALRAFICVGLSLGSLVAEEKAWQRFYNQPVTHCSNAMTEHSTSTNHRNEKKNCKVKNGN